VPPTRLLRRSAALACGLALTAAAAGQASAAQQPGDDAVRAKKPAPRTLFATTDKNMLIRIDARRPERIRDTLAISGLPDGVSLRGIDFRPRTGELYGVGSDSVVYRVSPGTGISVAEGAAFATGLSGQRFGVDFNPTVDKIRVVSDAQQNLRLNVDDGSLLLADSPLNPGMPQGVAAAYTNSGFSANPPATTMLFAVDAASDTVTLQNPPNNGTLASPQPLGIDVTDASFDIAGPKNTGYLATRPAGSRRVRGTGLYRVDPTTGRTRLIGTIGRQRRLAITGLAAVQDSVNNPAPPPMAPTQPPPATGPAPPAPTPSPSPMPPAPTPPAPSPAPAPPPAADNGASASIRRLPRTTLARFLRTGVRVTASCASAGRGTLRIEASRSQARRLGLRSRVLASRSVACAGNRLTTRLTPRRQVKRALRAARRSLTTTVRLRVGRSSDVARLVLRR
jgi:Domain of unknown function (DUF4394)